MLIKAEIAKLPVEQQEVLARIELSRARHRQQLLKQARGHGDWRSVSMGVYIIFLCGVVVFLLHSGDQNEKRFAIYALLGLTIFNSLIQIQTARTNRRMDALLELLDFDHKNQDASNNSKDEKAR